MAFVRRRPVLSAVIAVLVVLTVLSFLLPAVGGGGHGVRTVP